VSGIPLGFRGKYHPVAGREFNSPMLARQAVNPFEHKKTQPIRIGFSQKDGGAGGN